MSHQRLLALHYRVPDRCEPYLRVALRLLVLLPQQVTLLLLLRRDALQLRRLLALHSFPNYVVIVHLDLEVNDLPMVAVFGRDRRFGELRSRELRYLRYQFLDLPSTLSLPPPYLLVFAPSSVDPGPTLPSAVRRPASPPLA